MSFRRDGHPDELISASLSGDLTGEERAELDAHLAGCEHCRQTLAVFSEQRDILGGSRRLAPPRDLGARVRAGVEASRLPWWRRPGTWVGAVASLATVAAALLAVVVLGNITRGPVASTGSPGATASLLESIEPTASVQPPSVEPSATESAAPTPAPSVDPNPVGYLRLSIVDQAATMQVVTPEGSRELSPDSYAAPVHSALSPDGEWLAYQTLSDGQGLVDTYLLRIADGYLVQLYSDAADSPFALLAWSPDSTLLAFTGLSENGSEADVWVANTQYPDEGARQLTNTGRTFAASFYGGTDGDEYLWVSTAAEGSPSTDWVPVPANELLDAPVDLSAVTMQHSDGAFLPVASPNQMAQQPMVVFWRGEMALDEAGWSFSRGGMPHLTGAQVEGQVTFDGQDPLFDTLTVGTSGQAFRSARFAWADIGYLGNTPGLAVWDAQWEGTPQPAGFPDANRVYFGRPFDDVYIGPAQALDLADTDGGTVIDVAPAGGPYLAITVQTEAGAEGGSYGPTAELRIVTRNLGDVPDDVSRIAEQRVWIGPAFY